MTPETVLAAVDAVMSRPFEWGRCDCSSAACDVLKRLCGVDPMEQLRPLYNSSLGAARMIRSRGGMAALVEASMLNAGLCEGHAVGGLALSTDARSLLVCIQPGLWAGKSLSGYALTREAGKGWHA